MKKNGLKRGLAMVCAVLLSFVWSSPIVCPDGEVPQCPFPDDPLFTFFPHPNDCHWFFQCSNGVAYCKECPADLHWNIALETCDYPDRAECGKNKKVACWNDYVAGICPTRTCAACKIMWFTTGIGTTLTCIRN